MSAKIIAFFNNKGGVGKTSLVYHLAWMYQDLGLRVVAADLDPQANLTAAFLDEERLAEIWIGNKNSNTIYDCLTPLIKEISETKESQSEIFKSHIDVDDLPQKNTDVNLEKIDDNLALLIGDPSLAITEEIFGKQWLNFHSKLKRERALQFISSLWQIIQNASTIHEADIVLMDIGSNLGAINRAALIAADYIVIPLLLDLVSWQGLQHLRYPLQSWKKEWKTLLSLSQNIAISTSSLSLPQGNLEPIGYIISQLSTRLDSPGRTTYNRFINDFPKIYQGFILNQPVENNISIENDPNCLALLKNYQSLIPMAQEAHKPMFHLKPADGAIGAHTKVVRNVYDDFKKLAYKIAERTQVDIPSI